MTQSDATAEALQRGAEPGTGYVVGKVISQVLHPVVLAIISVVIVGLFALPSRSAGLLWALLCSAIQVVPPTIFYTIRRRQGVYSDEDVSVRSQRNELYLFGFLNLLISSLVLWLLQAPLAFIGLLLSGLLINILCWAINLAWKISVHAASIGSTATIATIFSLPLGVVLWISAVILGWARVRTRNHTPMQVIAGASLAALCILGCFRLFGLV